MFLLACFYGVKRIFNEHKERISEEERMLQTPMVLVMHVLFWILLNYEVNLFYHLSPEWGDMKEAVISTFWALYGIGLLVQGFMTYTKPLRILGLGLLGLTIFKVLIVDMADVEMLERIVGFIFLGILLIGGAYLYQRFAKMFEEERGGK
jgi:uncharacterized membrane protein